MLSASTPSPVPLAGGFAPRLSRPAAAHPLLSAFVALSLFSGVCAMSYVLIEPAVEKLVGEFSLPKSWRTNPRFGLDQDGRLILRIYDHRSDEWRDGRLTDLARPEIDEQAQRRMASLESHTRRAFQRFQQALAAEQRRGVPEFVHAGALPRYAHLRYGIKTNLLVTETLPATHDAPLLDLIDANGDAGWAMIRRMDRKSKRQRNPVFT